MKTRCVVVSAAVLAALLTLAGCGSAEVSTAELEDVVAAKMTEATGQAPDRVECPEPLPAEEGSTTRCVIYAGDDKLGITVTSEGRDGDQVTMDIQADDELME